MATATTTDRIAVCPFTVLVDSREQAPYTFDSIPPRASDAGKRLVVPTAYRGLDAGDYSIDGMEGEIALERKSLADLYGTLGGGRPRFEREIERLAKLQFAAVIIEADVREIWRPAEFYKDWRSHLNPRTVEGTIVSWSLDYPTVHWWPMGSRRAAELRTFAALEMFWRKKQHNAK
jgi:ERCC4-type nuclease